MFGGDGDDVITNGVGNTDYASKVTIDGGKGTDYILNSDPKFQPMAVRVTI